MESKEELLIGLRKDYRSSKHLMGAVGILLALFILQLSYGLGNDIVTSILIGYNISTLAKVIRTTKSTRRIIQVVEQGEVTTIKNK